MSKEINCTPVFYANKKAFDAGSFRRIINQGSTRSSKTYSIIQLLCTVGLSTNKTISVVSPSLPHLKKGARRDFLEIAEDWGFYKEDSFNRTDHIFTFDTGAYIEFFGADNSGRVRGPKRDVLFVNEGNLLNKAVYTQLAIRTSETIFVDFNPADEYNYVYDLIELPNTKFIHSTYLNNKGNLSKEQIEEIESLQHADENLWKVYGLGLRGTSAETIYTHWKLVDEMPYRGEIVYGQDFGFNNPSALVEVEFYEGAIYVDEMLYQSKLTTNDLISVYKDIGFDRSDIIYCDSAEPKTIEEITRAGFTALPSDKDVREGIRKTKSMPMYITKRSANLLKEIKSYKWKKDKEDKVLDEPVKFMDHAMDAMRYAVFTHLSIPQRKFYTA